MVALLTHNTRKHQISLSGQYNQRMDWLLNRFTGHRSGAQGVSSLLFGHSMKGQQRDTKLLQRDEKILQRDVKQLQTDRTWLQRDTKRLQIEKAPHRETKWPKREMVKNTKWMKTWKKGLQRKKQLHTKITLTTHRVQHVTQKNIKVYTCGW